MLAHSIPSPTNLQLQSPFVQLPAEIQHVICGFAFAANDPIVDPKTNASSTQLDSELHPPLGIALLQTCRRLYHDVDRRPLFAQNVFRFTTVDRLQSFIKQVDTTRNILDLEIDFRRLDSDKPEIAQEWLRTCGSLDKEVPSKQGPICVLHAEYMLTMSLQSRSQVLAAEF
ncbi:hypothetical protein IAQ61_008431 [Plenodomus lingam]|uniref:uncharacterized protein n=1 Tax=Leptosphaeria maculans TaxID=5022 RepID=UPI00331860B1|nr:hypothetical protein IAQ61_008431 [Plenodomus lingam]